MKYTTILFDLDGTILYTLPDLKTALNYALEKAGFPQRSMEEVRRFVGSGLRNLVLRASPEGTSDEQIDITLSDLKSYYNLHMADDTVPYDGVIELLGKLRECGYKIGVVSNKVDPAVANLMGVYFDGLVDFAIGEREGLPVKPAPDTTKIALAELGADESSCIYVGDSDVDVKTAHNAGLRGIFVSWGFRDKEDIKKAGAEHIVDSMDELFDAIRALG